MEIVEARTKDLEEASEGHHRLRDTDPASVGLEQPAGVHGRGDRAGCLRISRFRQKFTGCRAGCPFWIDLKGSWPVARSCSTTSTTGCMILPTTYLRAAAFGPQLPDLPEPDADRPAGLEGLGVTFAGATFVDPSTSWTTSPSVPAGPPAAGPGLSTRYRSTPVEQFAKL